MSKILFKEDIDQIVANKLGWPLEKVTINSKHLFKRLADTMDNPETISITVPKIGVLSVKRGTIHRFIRDAFKSKFDVSVKKLRNLYTKRDKIEECVESYVERQRHLPRNRFLRIYFTKTMNFEQLERHQNEKLD